MGLFFWRKKKKEAFKETEEIKREEALKKDEERLSKEKPKRYHVSQNKDTKSEHFKSWRVRKEDSDKTIKYFKTQKQAIDYAEDLARSQKTSIVIHKVDGSIRKQNY